MKTRFTLSLLPLLLVACGQEEPGHPGAPAGTVAHAERESPREHAQDYADMRKSLRTELPTHVAPMPGANASTSAAPDASPAPAAGSDAAEAPTPVAVTEASTSEPAADVAVTPASAASPAPAPAPAKQPQIRRYEVQRGDSLSRIAQRTQVSVAELMQWNELDNPNHIHPGQLLQVSPPTPELTVSQGDKPGEREP